MFHVLTFSGCKHEQQNMKELCTQVNCHHSLCVGGYTWLPGHPAQASHIFLSPSLENNALFTEPQHKPFGFNFNLSLLITIPNPTTCLMVTDLVEVNYSIKTELSKTENLTNQLFSLILVDPQSTHLPVLSLFQGDELYFFLLLFFFFYTEVHTIECINLNVQLDGF